MSNVIDLQTEDNLQYTFYPVSSGSVVLKVRANNDAHIALTTGPQESDPMYEVFIGGWKNTKSVIRKNKTKPDKAESDTPNILNGGEFRGFWVRWDGGVISAGKEGESIPFIYWQDPEPFPIGFVGVSTGWGASGTWKIEDSAEFDTPDNLEYQFGAAASGSLRFEYCGPHNCHVCLSAEPAEVDPMYEFIIGGWENTKSVIRHCRSKPDKVAVPTPNIVNPGEFKKFLIQWKCGRLIVRDGETGDVIMEWTDPSPVPVKYFGVRTGWGARVPSAPSAPGFFPPLAQFSAGGGPSSWVDATAGQIPPGAVVGGQDVSGEPIYVARAPHEGAIIPGKLAASHGCAYIPWGGQEHGKSEYQVLVGGPNNWVPVSGNNVPPGAFPGGESEDGEPLYIGRVRHEGSLTTGKVQLSHAVCYISFAGQELSFSDYEILMP